MTDRLTLARAIVLAAAIIVVGLVGSSMIAGPLALSQRRFDIVAPAGTSKTPSIYKIDRATGQVWVIGLNVEMPVERRTTKQNPQPPAQPAR